MPKYSRYVDPKEAPPVRSKPPTAPPKKEEKPLPRIRKPRKDVEKEAKDD